MRVGGAGSPAGHRTGARQEGGLTGTVFVGSFPTADFAVPEPLPEIALIGRSNVGKSTLLNALTGRRRLARVSATPGKTQTCNVYNVPGRYLLLDLPGYGYARASKRARAEFRRLIEAVATKRDRLAGAVWLLDLRRDPSPDDLAVSNLLADHGVPVLVAFTKSDKLARGQRATRVRTLVQNLGLESDQYVITSSVTWDGIEDLREAIAAIAGDVA